MSFGDVCQRHLCSLALDADNVGGLSFCRLILAGSARYPMPCRNFFRNRMIGELSRRKTPSHMRRGRNRLSAPVPRWKDWGRLRCGGTEQYRTPFLALDQGNKRPLLLPFAAAHRTQEQANNLVPPLSPPCLLPFSSQGNNRAVLLPFAATAKTRSQITRPASMADP